MYEPTEELTYEEFKEIVSSEGKRFTRDRIESRIQLRGLRYSGKQIDEYLDVLLKFGKVQKVNE